MTKELPIFKYHPDPLVTGSIVKSASVCECCGKEAEYIYKASFYSVEEVNVICPWCIHSGKAAEMYDGSFSDDWPLQQAGLSSEILAEVTKRTPGFESWQQEVWLTHCEDACAYLGDASKDDVRKLADGVGYIDDEQQWLPENYLELGRYYEPKGSPALYKFQCLHCQQILFGIDAC